MRQTFPSSCYNQPKYTGVEITPALMSTFIEQIPQVAGVKTLGAGLSQHPPILSNGYRCLHRQRLIVLAALTAGAAGVVDGPLTVAPEIWVEAYRAYREGRRSACAGASRDGRNVDRPGG